MSVAIKPMDQSVIKEWLDRARAAYVTDLVESGIGQVAAERTAAQQQAAAFPDGRPASGHTLFDVIAGGEVIGYLWIGPRDSDDVDHWWVWDIEIDAAWRGRGIGRAVMILAEAEARSHGCVEIGLSVVADNPARRLYESLGYREASVRMRKPLTL